MTREARTTEDVHAMADEVSRLLASRFGGARRGELPPLQVMLRRRGAALPARLRKPAARLAEADTIGAQPKIARQLDLAAIGRDHAALIAHLQPLGEFSRLRRRAVNFAASLSLGLLVLGGVIIWIMVERGHL